MEGRSMTCVYQSRLQNSKRKLRQRTEIIFFPAYDCGDWEGEQKVKENDLAHDSNILKEISLLLFCLALPVMGREGFQQELLCSTPLYYLFSESGCCCYCCGSCKRVRRGKNNELLLSLVGKDCLERWGILKGPPSVKKNLLNLKSERRS